MKIRRITPGVVLVAACALCAMAAVLAFVSGTSGVDRFAFGGVSLIVGWSLGREHEQERLRKTAAAWGVKVGDVNSGDIILYQNRASREDAKV